MRELTRQDWSRIVVLVLAIVVGLIAAYFVAGWIVVSIAVLIVAMIVALVAAWPFLPMLQGSVGANVPPELNPILVEHIDHAKERIAKAKTILETAQVDLTSANTAAASAASAAAATPADPAVIRDSNEKVKQAQQAVARAQAVVDFEESQLENLLHPGLWQWFRGRASWMQYLVFGSLAAFVLYKLMESITSSPPPGTTPRGLITLLISVVTVGIALILVLSTIISENFDEKRFSQGKEVLTALLGVLGTIVGFYFGTTQDQVSGFSFEPVVIRMEADKTISLSTKVQGGKAPYFYAATFTPASIPGTSGKSESGSITAVIDGTKLKAETDVSVVISVTDSTGKTDQKEYNAVIRLQAGGIDSPESQ